MSLIDCLHNYPLNLQIENKHVKAFLLMLDEAQEKHEFNIQTKQGANHLNFKITAQDQNFANAYFYLGQLYKMFKEKNK